MLLSDLQMPGCTSLPSGKTRLLQTRLWESCHGPSDPRKSSEAVEVWHVPKANMPKTSNAIGFVPLLSTKEGEETLERWEALVISSLSHTLHLFPEYLHHSDQQQLLVSQQLHFGGWGSTFLKVDLWSLNLSPNYHVNSSEGEETGFCRLCSITVIFLSLFLEDFP